MKILLRFVEGAAVALCQSEENTLCRGENNSVELLPTRYDLYPYHGGIAWGYTGSGPTNLAYAIAARIFEYEANPDFDSYSSKIKENLLATLDQDKEYDLTSEMIRSSVQIN